MTETGQTIEEFDAAMEAKDRVAGGEFHVTDLATADWLVARIVDCDRKEREVKEQAAAMIAAESAKIEGWRDMEAARLERRRQFFVSRYGPELEVFVKARCEEERKKSVALPHGTAGFRKGQDRVIVDEEKTAMAAAETACPDAIIVKRSLSLTALKAHTKATGEVLDGTHVEEGKEEFYVK